MSKLPERYRRATNIHEGYEMRTPAGEWLKVTRTIIIYAPVRCAKFEFTGGDFAILDPSDEIMSRRTA